MLSISIVAYSVYYFVSWLRLSTFVLGPPHSNFLSLELGSPGDRWGILGSSITPGHSSNPIKVKLSPGRFDNSTRPCGPTLVDPVSNRTSAHLRVCCMISCSRHSRNSIYWWLNTEAANNGVREIWCSPERPIILWKIADLIKNCLVLGWTEEEKR